MRHASSINDDDSNEELGNSIYQRSPTATARARQAETQNVAATTATHERLPDQNQSLNSLSHNSAHGTILVPAKRQIATDKGNSPTPLKMPRTTCHVGPTKKAREGGVYISHGKKVAPKRCGHGVCNNQAANGGICVRQGANQKRKGSNEECTNIALTGGGCMGYGSTPASRLCSHGGCTNRAQQGGICVSHRKILKDAAMEDVPSMLNKEESAGDTGQM